MSLHRLLWPAFVLATVLYYSILLFAPQASIHWNLADVAYPVQKFISDSLHAGELPFWAPYAFSGTPLLSDPRAGAWYPLHWPFFAIGVTPPLMAWEIALHAFLALAGAYLLARRLFGDPLTAVLSAVFYAWGGFFAASSSELALFEAAALFPWLLWTATEALESGSLRWISACGAVAGLTVLAGHLDAVAYAFLGLVCFLAGYPGSWRNKAGVTGAVALFAALLPAVAVLPWLEIAGHTTRTGADAREGASLVTSALGTLLSADYLGLIGGGYRGPANLRYAYLYSGLLAGPLAIAGLLRRVGLGILLALIVPASWYAFGPPAGLARALAWIPLFHDARAPVEIWFVAALGLALAAGSGAAYLTERTKRARLPYILLLLSCADLWFWNLYKNPLVLAKLDFEQLYGRTRQKFAAQTAEIRQDQFHRIWAAQPVNIFGPLNGALISRTGATFGSGLLELRRHAEYTRAVAANPLLLNTLATHGIDLERGVLSPNPGALGFVTTPRQVIFRDGPEAARAALNTLDPAQAAIVEASARPLSGGVERVTGEALGQSSVRLNYSAAGAGFLRIAVPYAPGWTASVDGTPVEIVPADYAFLGVFVPPGHHELTLEFRPRSFGRGALTSAVGLALLLAALAWPQKTLSTASGRPIRRM